MKNLYFLLFVSFAFSISITHAQEIPNGGFEDWEQLIWTLNPMGWETNNEEASASVVQDSLPYSGELAMRVNPYDIDIVSVGLASTTVPLTAIPEALNFYAKWEKTSSCFATVKITFFNNEDSFYNEAWIADPNESEWIYISLPLNQIEPIMTHAVIEVEVNVGDLVPGDGWLSIDDIHFGEATGIPDLNSELFSIGPNPSSNQLTVFYDEEKLKDTQINIYDIEGRLVYQNRISRNIDISSLETGNYIVQVIFGDEVVKKQFTLIR